MINIKEYFPAIPDGHCYKSSQTSNEKYLYEHLGQDALMGIDAYTHNMR